MAATAARSSFINPWKFDDGIPSQTPIIAVNLPKRRRSHRCTSNDKRPLQLNYGAKEGPRRLRVGYQRSFSDDNSFNMEVDFFDDPLLADVVIKERKYFSSLLAQQCVDDAKQELGANAADKEMLWADLFAESKLCKKLKQEYNDSKILYMLQRIHKETSKEDFEKKLPVEEVDFWISGVDDPLLADVVTKERKYFSSLIAELIVNATKRKLGANAADKEPLWVDLVAESKHCEKLQQEYKDSKLRYMRRRLLFETSEEDFEEMLYTFIIELNTKGQQYSAVVTKWLKKYGSTLLGDMLLKRESFGIL